MTAKAEQRAALAKGSRKRQLETRTFFTWFQVTIFYHDDASDCDEAFANLSSNLFLQDNMDPSQDDVAEVIKDDLWYEKKI